MNTFFTISDIILATINLVNAGNPLMPKWVRVSAALAGVFVIAAAVFINL